MPRNRVEKRTQAIHDLLDAALYLAEESGSEELAFKFIDAAEATLQQLADMPEMGAAREYDQEAIRGLRMWRITGFHSHLIFYRPLHDGIEVVRVLHAKRDIESLFTES